MRLSFHHPWIPDYPDFSIIFIMKVGTGMTPFSLSFPPVCRPACRRHGRQAIFKQACPPAGGNLPMAF